MRVLALTPHKPIFYPPGMISLVLLPVFCLVFLFQHKAFVNLGYIDVAMFDSGWDAKKISETYHIQFPPVRSYLDINLNGNDAANKTRLDFAQLAIREILDSKDTHKGVKFHFGKTSKYWSYVQAYDICQIEGVPGYGQYRDDLYVTYFEPKVDDDAGGGFFCGTMMLEQEARNREEHKERLKAIDKMVITFWPVGIAFLTMSFFAIRKLFFKS